MTILILTILAISLLPALLVFGMCLMRRRSDLMASGPQVQAPTHLGTLHSETLTPTDYAGPARHSLIEATQPKPNTLPQWLAIQGVVK
jgi:hypothetical protein